MSKIKIERVILVDKNNRKIGIEEKIRAHKKGKLHRAFSVIIFNSEGELLIQKRAKEKYHSAGLWANACCSHPRPKEKLEEATHRRLKEEMGFDCELKKAFNFIYKVNLKNELIEHELDHVFFGEFGGNPKPNKKEVIAYKWISIKNLRADIKKNPDKYASWFKIILNKTKYFKDKVWEVEMIGIEEVKIKTKKKFQIIDITNKVKKHILKEKVDNGEVSITTKHTTTAIRINENEPRLFKDIKKYLDYLVPENKKYYHDEIEKRKHCPKNEPKNAPAHIKALLMGASETLPIEKGKLNLGKWQRVLFIEMDGPRNRTYTIELIANKKI